jgi:hypothetical protein
MKRIPLLMTFIVLSLSCVAETSAACTASDSFVRPQGWEIPGLDGAVVASKQNIQIGADTVLAESLTPKSPVTTRLEIECSKDGRLEERRRPVKVWGLTRFSMNGRVFGYMAATQRLPEGGGTGVIGLDRFEEFYDMDGSGRFTVRRDRDLREKMIIPPWAR